jgi:hypothetical protein
VAKAWQSRTTIEYTLRKSCRTNVQHGLAIDYPVDLGKE